jgi:hypothetical protein
MLRTRIKPLSMWIYLPIMLFCGCFTRFSMVRSVPVYRSQDAYVEMYTAPTESYGYAALAYAYDSGYYDDPYFDWYGGTGFHFSVGFHTRPIHYYGMLHVYHSPVFTHWGRIYFVDAFPFWHYPVYPVIRYPRYSFHYRPVYAHGFRDWRHRSHHRAAYGSYTRGYRGSERESFAHTHNTNKRRSVREAQKPRTFSRRNNRSIRQKEPVQGRSTEKRSTVVDRSRNHNRVRRTAPMRKTETKMKDSRTKRRNTQLDRKRTVGSSVRNKSRKVNPSSSSRGQLRRSKLSVKRERSAKKISRSTKPNEKRSNAKVKKSSSKTVRRSKAAGSGEKKSRQSVPRKAGKGRKSRR